MAETAPAPPSDPSAGPASATRLWFALLPLLAPALVVLLVRHHHGTDWSPTWTEHGRRVDGLAGLAAALACTGLSLWSAQRARAVALWPLALAWLPSVVGGALRTFEQATRPWMARCGPLDAVGLLASDLHEVATASTFGFEWATALAGTAALSALAAALIERGSERRVELAAALLLAVTAVASALLLAQRAMLASYLHALITAEPVVRALLVHAPAFSAAAEPSRVLPFTALLATACCVGALWLRLGLVRLGSVVLAAAMSVAGVSGVDLRVAFADQPDVAKPAPLLPVEGRPLLCPVPFLGDVSAVFTPNVEPSARAAPRHAWAQLSGDTAAITLQRDASPAALHEALTELSALPISTLLLVGHDAEPAAPPSARLLHRLAAALELHERAVAVGLEPAPAACEGDCHWATVLSGCALVVDEQCWQPEDAPVATPHALKAVALAVDAALSPRQLVQAAQAAWRHGVRLVLVATVAPEPTVGAGSTGRSANAALLEVVTQRSHELGRCVAREGVPPAGVLRLSLHVDGDGVPAQVSVTGAADEAVRACAVATVRRWRFPKPADGRPVPLSYPWLFKPVR